MPVIARFYGILIKRMIREWAQQYQTELQAMWRSQNYQKLSGLED